MEIRKYFMDGRLLAWVLMISLTPQVSGDPEPGFDCGRASNFVEEAVCEDSWLASLDNYLNSLYRRSVDVSLSPDRLKRQQIKWIRDRNDCQTRACVEKSYLFRINEIIYNTQNIDEDFVALNPSVVLERFEHHIDRSRSEARRSSSDSFVDNPFVSGAFGSLGRASIDAFMNENSGEYKFEYRYEIDDETFHGLFVVDASGELLSVDNGRDLPSENDTNYSDNIYVIYSVLIEADSEEIEGVASFLELLEEEPSKTLSGSGVLPCDRHDGTLYVLNGSDSSDSVECSWGDEIIDTYNGDDQIDGGHGDEIIASGPGTDTIVGSWGDEVIYPGAGDDELSGGWGEMILVYGKDWGNDVVKGSCSLVIFSVENKQEDFVWENNRILHNKGNGGSIQFEHVCNNIFFSTRSF